MNQPLQNFVAVTLERPRPIYRDPKTLNSKQVCPHCKRETVVCAFLIDSRPVIIYHCPEHHGVIPMRSAIFRDDSVGQFC